MLFIQAVQAVPDGGQLVCQHLARLGAVRRCLQEQDHVAEVPHTLNLNIFSVEYFLFLQMKKII